MAQWLGLRALTAEGLGSIPGRGTKMPQAARRGKKKKGLSPNPAHITSYYLKEGLVSNKPHLSTGVHCPGGRRAGEGCSWASQGKGLRGGYDTHHAVEDLEAARRQSLQILSQQGATVSPGAQA